jgi:hypothetical protein
MLLPWEKIPIFIWGLILAAIMAFLALKADPFTQQQAVFTVFAMLGVAALSSTQGKDFFAPRLDAQLRHEPRKGPLWIDSRPSRQQAAIP